MKTCQTILFSCFFIFIPFIVTADSRNISVGMFSQGDLAGWENKELEGKTVYTLVVHDNRKVIKAESDGTASGFLKEVRIDLDKTPFLNWSWKIEKTLNIQDEKTKPGDDYPARMYVIAKIGWTPWGVNALNYVWSSGSPVGSDWPNPFTSKAWMIAVESGDQSAGQWKNEKRNVQEDFEKSFNKKIRYIDAVAVMTDTDNSKTSAVAYYGDIYFSRE